jgi:hypothetical protein
MAGDALARDPITYDPLSAITRRERTALLGVSMLGVALVKVPLVPEKFSALGIEFAQVQQQTFVGLYALIVAFYLAAFLIYAATDFVAWQRQDAIMQNERAHELAERRNQRVKDGPLSGDPREGALAAVARVTLHPRISIPTFQGAASDRLAALLAGLRAAFEFALPMAFAGYALYALLTFKA